ncbi:MAG: 1,4-beta-xylanase [Acidobacteriales bacterium 59-55]|nr:MAG: 1,4-beta-xylanase [Acidobacteriales bacterium 59-55]
MRMKLRRIGGSVLAVLLGVGTMQGQQAQSMPASEGTTVLLWPNGAPGAKGDQDVDKPTLTIYLPSGANATKTGVVVAPGGGYEHLSMTKEGSDVAHWLNQRGVAAFVLKYRLGPTYHNPIELGDAQRAMRMVRANASEYGIAPDHIGMWGFSAGGHLTATTGTHFDSGNPSAADPIDRQGSRPDFLILAYPVITMDASFTHSGSRRNLLGDNPDPAVVLSMSNELQVTKDTPPTFLFSTTDDQTVPVMNSVAFYSALVKSGVPAEMHLFQHGRHGSGLGVGNPQLSVWPDLLIKWMRERGYAAPATAAATGN